ncbi:MAG TPA: 3-deoxy-7-phosphoheptulonate synthase, partial [Gammaproteobacteria bacterium]|nr:3-deoxy-7-phosphoheptulonate synthase [Gammaproteobacteria bacterium]
MELENINIETHQVLITPEQLKAELPVDGAIGEAVKAYRKTVQEIVARRDPRLLVVVGPCSIHDPQAALEYATKLSALAGELDDKLFCVMRAYFEKPRSTVGWKGLINDPFMDDSFKVHEGLRIARKLLLDIT